MILITISVLLLLLSALLFIKAVQKNRRKKALKNFDLLRSYNRLVFIHRASPDYSEQAGNRIIAIDKARHLLIFVAQHTRPEERCIFLQEISSVNILIDEHFDGSICCVFLRLENKRTRQYYLINFFHESFDKVNDMQALMRKALRWKHRIHQHLSPSWFSNDLLLRNTENPSVDD